MASAAEGTAATAAARTSPQRERERAGAEVEDEEYASDRDGEAMEVEVTGRATRPADLPIAASREAIVSQILASKCLVVVGETGSGKTTQLPQYLHAAGLAAHGPIVITQPRRVAAMSVAARVAEEMGSPLGHLVGYQVRFDNNTSSRTDIKYATDGSLLRECLEDPTLSKYSAVILDEAHIRSMETDILFGLVKEFIVEAKAPREYPKLIVMSATLESNKFSDFFRCNVCVVPGRTFPVEVRHWDLVTSLETTTTTNYTAKAVDVVMDIHTNKPEGDILLFLTGRAEIEKACDSIFMRAERLDYQYDVMCKDVDALLVLPVYGTMPSELQHRIFNPAPPRVRKCIVATDIASTSLTIDGIRYVVDSGFVKQKAFNPRTGLDSLEIVPISRSEAKQRAGRAGRTQPGECHRIYSEEFQDSLMLEFTPPEIQRTSLTSVVLTLKSMGIHDVLQFSYLDAPEDVMILEALRQLYFFDALDKNGKVTELGKRMVDFPLTPSLSRVLLHSADRADQEALLTVVAMLSVENVFIRPNTAKLLEEANERHDEIGARAGDDFTALLYVMQACDQCRSVKRWCKRNFVHFRAVKTARQIRDQLHQILVKRPTPAHPTRPAAVARGRRGERHAEARDGGGKRIRSRSPPHSASKSARRASPRRRSPDRHRHRGGHDRDAGPGYRQGGLNGDARCAPIPQETREAVRLALCHGFFHNVARGAGRGDKFRTMDGHATLVAIHPSSCLFRNTEHLNWVIFNEVIWTTQPYMRTVAPIEYSWVKDLLPKLHEVNVHMLAGSGAVTGLVKDPIKEREKIPIVRPEAVERKTSEQEVDAAKARYLARKRARQQQQHGKKK